MLGGLVDPASVKLTSTARRRWATRTQLRPAIITWIETTYHRRRRQDGLGRLTPIEYDTLLRAAPAA